MNCKICSRPANIIFTKTVLGKYPVNYYQCPQCSFVQTEHPHWLKEAYESVITSLDIGLISRNLYLANVVKGIINAFFDKKGRFLDYGGGYGLFVRLLRDEGFDFYREDRFCENIFAKNFDISDVPGTQTFEIITAFEIFEHFAEPVEEVEKMLQYGNSILFSTELQPPAKELQSWEYIAPETGQHVAFYSYGSLLELSKKFHLNLYTNKRNLHLLTKKKISQPVFTLLTRNKVAALYNLIHPKQGSLLQSDYNMIKEKINRRQ